jgi:prepilin-type processing-associated H-X9-DG protein
MKRINCSNNLRQLGLATSMYAGDNGDWIPNPYDDHYNWRHYLLPYVGNPEVSIFDAEKGTYHSAGSVFNCPAWTEYPLSSMSGYGMNFYIPPMNGWSDVYDPIVHPRLTSVAQPATMALYADSGGWHLSGKLTQTNGYGTYMFDRFRHNGGANILFLDMHVKYLKSEEIQRRKHELYGPVWQEAWGY